VIFRSFTSKRPIGLLDTWQASVIKGNPGELAVLAGSNEVLRFPKILTSSLIPSKVQSKGVDSVGPGFKDPVNFVRRLAQKERECQNCGFSLF